MRDQGQKLVLVGAPGNVDTAEVLPRQRVVVRQQQNPATIELMTGKLAPAMFGCDSQSFGSDSFASNFPNRREKPSRADPQQHDHDTSRSQGTAGRLVGQPGQTSGQQRGKPSLQPFVTQR